MYCNNCGTNNQFNTQFCVNCGAPLAPAPMPMPMQRPKTSIWPIIVVPVVVILIVLLIVLTGSSKKYVGTWNCKGYSTTTGESSNYMVTMILKSNGEYTFGQYGDLDNNHSKGTFTAQYEDAKKNSTGKDFYLLQRSLRHYS